MVLVKNKKVARPYQKECIDLINQQEEGRFLIVVATGLGKTFIFTHIKRKGRVLIISHRDELVRQPEQYYDCSFGIEKAEEHSHGEEVVSASVASLAKDSRLSRFRPDDFHTIIIDEAHHAAAPSYKKILEYFSGAKLILGVTATPTRGDKVRLSDVFDKILFERSLPWGIKNHYLASIRGLRVHANYSLKNVKKIGGDFSLEELGKNVLTADVLAKTSKVYLEECYKKQKHALLYCVSVKNGEMILEAIRKVLPRKEQETVQMITGKTEGSVRQKILEDFKNEKVRLIINCMVLTEGTDLPIADVIINLRPTCNSTLYQQMVGRGTRLYKNKEYCTVIDIVPDDSSERYILTAPTLFGIDPNALSPSQKAKTSDLNTDLLEYCESISQEFADLQEDFEALMNTIHLRVERLDAFIEKRETLIEESKNDGFGAIASSYQSVQQEDDELDFGDYRVEIGPSDKTRYKIKTGFDDFITLSKPDVLNNTQFECITNGKHYVSTMKFEDALNLIDRICNTLNPKLAFLWSQKAFNCWNKEDITPNQEKRILRDFKKYDVKNDASSLSKAQASDLIELANEMKAVKKEADEYRFKPRTPKAKKEAIKELFLFDEKAKKQAETEGQKAFKAFLADLEKREKKRAAYNEQIKAFENQLQTDGVSVKIDIWEISPMPSSVNQDRYLFNLLNNVARLNFFLPDSLSRNLNVVEASILISILKEIDRMQIRLSTPYVLSKEDFDEVYEEIFNHDGKKYEKMHTVHFFKSDN